MKKELLKQVEELCMQEGLLEGLKQFLSALKGMPGANNEDQWKLLREKTMAWGKQNLSRHDTVSVYGFLNWYLDIWVGEFQLFPDSDLKNMLIKMLLILALSETDNNGFTHEMSINEYLEYEHNEWANCHSCTLLSHNEFIADLQRIYSGSNRRLLNHLQKYKEQTALNKSLMEAQEKYLNYIACIKGCSGIEQIVRINRLGICENGNAYRTQYAMYFMLQERSIVLMTFSDFA